MQTKIKREKLIKIDGFLHWLHERRKWTIGREREEQEVAECWGREAVSASDRRLSSGFAGGGILFFFFIWRLHRSGESVGCGCGGVVAGRRWQTGQNKAFFSCWLKKCNKRVDVRLRPAVTDCFHLIGRHRLMSSESIKGLFSKKQTKKLRQMTFVFFYCFPLTKQSWLKVQLKNPRHGILK